MDAPNSSASCIEPQTRAVRMIALEGTDPTFSEFPPRRLRSMSATENPSRAADSAAASPAGPAPTIARS